VTLFFDASVWIEHLRRAVLDEVIGDVRGRFVLGLDAVVAAELRAGCRSKRERSVVARLLRPYERSGRLLCPERNDFERAALALSRLRERGRLPSGGKSALLDALIAAVAIRRGALLVTVNMADFASLATVMPLRVEAFDPFRQRLASLRTAESDRHHRPRARRRHGAR
jgi:predicted nucleic acid-binding protein